MYHHTLVHEVDLNIIERPRARKAEKLAVGEGAQKPSVPESENKPLDQSEKSREQCHHSVCLGCEVGGRALVKELPVLLFSEKANNKLWRCVTQDVTQHSWMKNWLSHLVLKTSR